MRIFCAVRHSIDPRKHYGGLWSANFYPAILSLGHEIIESSTDLAPTSALMDVVGGLTKQELLLRSETTASILKEVRSALKSAPVDLFLSYFYNSHFDPAGFDELRRLGIPTVNFYCNSTYQFELVNEIAAKVDFAWHAEKDARAIYLAAGANPVWVQMAADPQLYHPVPTLTRLPKACFVGQRYADRDRWMSFLVRAGLPVEIYGAGWKVADRPRAKRPFTKTLEGLLDKRHRPPGSLGSYINVLHQNVTRMGIRSGLYRSLRQLKYRSETRGLDRLFVDFAKGPAAEIATVFAKYEVCLNFSNVWSDGRPGSDMSPHVRLRDFEAPMCRCCYLTGHTDEIGEFYEIGREIDTYRTPEELVDKTRFYLNNPDAAEKLREAGYRRALRDHTWKNRFEQLFQATALSDVT